MKSLLTGQYLVDTKDYSTQLLHSNKIHQKQRKELQHQVTSVCHRLQAGLARLDYLGQCFNVSHFSSAGKIHGMHVRDPNISENNGVDFTKIRLEADLGMFSMFGQMGRTKRDPRQRMSDSSVSRSGNSSKTDLW